MSTLINIFSEMAQAIRIAEGSNSLYTPLNMPMAINNLIQNVTYENVYNDDRDNQNYIAELKANLIGETTTIDSTLCANIMAFNQSMHIKSSLPVRSVEDTKYVVNHLYEVTDANNKYNGVSVLPDPIVVIGPSVTNIANIFYNASQLTSDLGNNIMINAQGVIDMSGAFFNCSNLTGSPICGNNVVNMYGTYFNCSNLTGNVFIPNSTENITNTFDKCRNLSSVTLPNKFNNGVTTNFWANCPVSVANGNLIFY